MKMTNDFKIESDFDKLKTIQLVKKHLNESQHSNLELTLLNDTYIIQKSKNNLSRKSSLFDSFMIQFIIIENPETVVLDITSQTYLISLVINILFLPLIWIFILVFLFEDSYSFLNRLFFVTIGFSVTSFFRYQHIKNRKLEQSIINGIRSNLQEENNSI